MYFDIQCSTNVELSVLQQNQLTLSVEGWKLVDIKLKRWMACEPTTNTSWQLIFLVAIICGSHSRRFVNCDHLCTHGDIFVFSFVLLFVCIYFPILNCGQNSPIPNSHIFFPAAIQDNHFFKYRTQLSYKKVIHGMDFFHCFFFSVLFVCFYFLLPLT